MKTFNFSKSNSHKYRRKIVITEINKLLNLSENQLRQERIFRELGKLHSLWFQGTAKDMRILELHDTWQREQANLVQVHL